VANPSIWPLVAAVGTVAIFAAELFKLRWGAFAGAAIVLVGVVLWNRPYPAPITEREELAFEEEHGIPVRVGGSVAVARWGMGLIVLFVAIAAMSLLLSYFYLMIENPDWPPVGFALPGLGMPSLAAGLVVVSGLVIIRARTAIRDESRTGLIAGAVVATLLLLGAGVIQSFLLGGLPFNSKDHAYGSIYYTVGGFVLVVAAAAVIMGLLTIYWTWRGEYTARRHAPVDNVVRFWLATVVIWAIGFGVLYLTPYLT
jgi:cytochrome c oxidase subunit I+III